MKNAIGDPISDHERVEIYTALQSLADRTSYDLRKLLKRGAPEDTAAYMAQIAEDTIEQTKGRKHWACTRGCAYCCSLGVAVTPPEAFLIARVIMDNCTPDELAEAKANLEARAAAARGATSARDYLNRKIRCAFLTEDNSCAIHQIRPLVCRGYASFDRDSCRTFAEVEGSHIISDELVRYITGALITSFQEALRQAHFDGEFYELHGAILVAMRPESLERWKAGKRVFKDCSIFVERDP